MKKLYALLFLLFAGLGVFAQTFTNSTGGAIPDPGTQCFDVTVSGVGITNSAYGLASVCLNITHTYDEDLTIILKAPDGTSVVLSQANGSSGDNYTGTCFSASATTSINNGTAPFTGTYTPAGPIGAFNNNINADGVWQLCIEDGFGSDNGTLLNFSLTFSNTPAPPAPVLPSCSGNAPAGDACDGATPVCNFFGYCGNTSSSYNIDTWTQLSTAFCGSIDNNSFVTFVASGTSASFNVWVYNSANGDGVQMFFYDGGCGSGAVTEYGCENQILPTGTSGDPFLVSASGLTPGNTYYLMFDGWAGDVCDYTLAPVSGVNILTVSPVNVGSTTTICPGGSGVALQASGGSGNYVWTPATGLSATTGSPITANPPSTTTYTVTSNNGSDCPTSTQVTVTVVPFNPLRQDTAISICGGGTINLTTLFALPGGTTATWTGPGYTTLPNPAAVGAQGTYTLVVGNSSGCKDSVHVNLTFASKPELGTPQTAQFCRGGSYALSTTLFNMTGITTSSWTFNNAAVANPGAVTAIGVYSLIGANGSGCKDTATLTLSYFPKPALGADASVNVCPGTVVNLSTVFNLTGLTPAWTLGGSAVANPSAITVAGTYQLIATNTDGCKDTANAVVSFNGSLNLGNDTTVNICLGQTKDLPSLYPAAAGYTNTWTLSANPVANPNAVSAIGTYMLVSTNGSGCNDTALVNLGNFPKPSLGADASASICPGVNFNLTTQFNTTGLTPSWTIGGSPVATPASITLAGTYQLIAANANGCTDTASLVLSYSARPNLGNDTTISICQYQSTDLTALYNLSGLTTVWSQGATTITNPTAITATGVYQLIASNAGGCKDTALVTVSFKAKPALGADKNIAICAAAFPYDVSGAFTTTGFTTAWTDVIGTSVNATAISSGGTYQLIATNAVGCSDTAKVTITVSTKPNIGADQTAAVCPGSAYNLTSAFVTTGLTTSWTSAAGAVANPASVIQPGTYTLIVTNTAGCKDTATLTLNNSSAPALGRDSSISICQYQSADLTVLYNVSGLTTAWTQGVNTVANPAAVTAAGVYQLIATNTNGCKDTALATVSYKPKPALGANKTVAICAAALPYDVSTQFSTAGLTTAWTDGAAAAINPANITGAGTYQLIATNADGCSDTATIVVNISPKPSLGADKTAAICPGTSYNLTTQFVTTGLTSNWTLSGAAVANPASITQQGTYTLTVTNTDGCKDTASLTLSNTVAPALGNDAAVSICQYQSTDLTTLYNTTGLTNTWTFGAVNVANPAAVTANGTYQLIATNTDGCKDTALVNVSYKPTPALGANKTVAICAAALPYDVSTQFTTAGLTTAWTDGTTASINPANITGAGTYQLIATNTDGCSDTATVVVNISPKPSLGADKTAAICPGTSYNLTTQFVTTGLTSSWTSSTGAVANPASVTQADTYTLVVTNTDGCKDTATLTLSNTVAPALGNDAAVSICQYQSTDLTTLYNTTGLTSNWTLGTTIITNPSAATAAGVYQLIVTNTNGCKDTALVTVSYKPKPALGANKTVNICPGTFPTDISTLYTTTGFTSNWTLAGTVINPANVSDTGTYQLIVINTDGCSDTATVKVGLFSKPNLGADKTVNVCPASSFNLTTQFTTTNLASSWTIGGAAVANPAAITVAGVYQLIVTSVNGCKDTATVTLGNFTKPNLGIDGNTSVCPGTPVNLTTQFATTGLSTAWSVNTAAVANPAAVIPAATYQVIATDANSCKDTALFTVNHLAKPNIGTDQAVNVCQGTSANLLPVFTTAGLTTNWTFSSNPVTNPAAVTQNGGYQLIVTNSVGCADTAIANVNFYTKPALGADKLVTVCPGARVDLTQQFVTTGLLTVWTRAGLPVATPSNVTATGSYRLVATNTNGCSDTAQVTVNNYTKPNLGPDVPGLVCRGDSFNLTLPINTGALSTSWSFNGSAVTDPKAVLASGSYQLIVTDGNTCKDTLNLNLAYYPKPNLGVDRIVRICIDSAANLVNQFNLSGIVATNWTTAAGAPLANPTFVNTAGDYQVIGFNATGCRDTVKITVVNQPRVVAFAGSDTVSVYGAPLQLTATGGVTYTWSPASVLNNPNIPNPQATLFADSTRLTVIVKDVAGCVGFDTIWVKTYQGPTYYVPNAFTPNGDGVNDVFRPKPVGISRTDWFRIFNRYGQLVFETVIPEKGWDGMLKGVKQPVGNYVWMISGTGYNGRQIEMKGNVLLLQ